ncbi:hypothetical protein O6H91_09G119700 [Diphasiastrum complanatum]|uniref:Uncharacterized protein n=4 Tax=Diphasiastrum complanatum TaxID=34168 RepID=A0ACC2CUT6_DIPCM|nr:hypothetical protein O6H91_09G119700 [Diphasiastrum complanatum]KAJ7545432.1 hypothetical protein O6H91_09G119700 [Diphasiastrum complanatum]KAJ7545434.1 hypothetical protein O6H91_09G119700 [Diphasiastrum complanatum]KAJ7545436.1 hypothetical protein O6H91_09G119700 [Diphasiastrum complanatum]
MSADSYTAAKLDLNAPLISMRRRHAAPALQIVSSSDSKVGETIHSDFQKDEEGSYRKISYDLVAERDKSLVQLAKADEGSSFNIDPSKSASARATAFSDHPENDDIRYQRKSRQISLEDKGRVHSPSLLDTFIAAENSKQFSSTSTAQENPQLDFPHFEEENVTKSLELRTEEEWDALSDQVEQAYSAHNEALTPTSDGTLISGSDGFPQSRNKDHPVARDFIMNRFIPAAMAIAGQSPAGTASPVDVRVHNDHRRVESMVQTSMPCSDLCGAPKEDQQRCILDVGTIMHLQAPSRSTKFKSVGEYWHSQFRLSTLEHASGTIIIPEDEHCGSQETSNQHEPDKPEDSQGMDSVSRFDSIGLNNSLSETTDVKSMSVSEGGSSRTSFTNKYRNEESLSCKGKGFLGLPNDRIQERSASNDGSHSGPYGAERLRTNKHFENKWNSGFLLPSPGTSILHKEPDSNVKLQEPSSLRDRDKLRTVSSYYSPHDNTEISLDQPQNRDEFRKKSEQGSSCYGGEDNKRHDYFDEERTKNLTFEVKNRTEYATMHPSLRAIRTSSNSPVDLSNKRFLQENIVKEEPRASLLHMQALPPPSSPAKSWLKKTVQSSMPTPTPFAPPKEFSALHPKKEVLPAEHSRWEEVVKSRNLRPDHLRYSEERLEYENPSN